MSRVGKKPIPIPEKTKITFNDRVLTVQGQKGTLSREIHPDVDLAIESGIMHVKTISEGRANRAVQGLVRTLVANMVHGVNQGFERVLEISGIGYRAEVAGKAIVLNLGYSHPINFELPEGVSAKVERNTIIHLSGIDKELLGQTAASIRRLRPPEPYKGKGIRYGGERVRKKAGKTGTK
jgi:large subunit ribosomal protein L6